MRLGSQFAGIAGLVVIVFGLITSFLIEYDIAHFIPLHFVVGVLLVGYFVISGGWQTLRQAASRRRAGFGLSNALYTLLFVAIIVVVNYIALRQSFLRFDTTEQKVYTLAPQTAEILERINEPIEIRGFYVGGGH